MDDAYGWFESKLKMFDHRKEQSSQCKAVE